MTTITASNLYPCFNAGTPNNRQLAMFGMKWPLRHGWTKDMIGRQVPDDFLPKLASLRKRSGPVRVELVKPVIVKIEDFTRDDGTEMMHIQIDLDLRHKKWLLAALDKLPLIA
jgi:hypothetical protein